MRRATRTATLAAGAVTALALMALSACTAATSVGSPEPSSSAPFVAGVVDTAGATLANTLQVRNVAPYPAGAAVADGVLPPTNRWYSSLAYAELPAKAYPSPIAVTVDAGSLRIELPVIVASDKLIAAHVGPGVGLAIDGSTARPLVTVNDPVWTSLSYVGADDGAVATATVAQGWPAVGLVAEAQLTLTLDAAVSWFSPTAGSAEVDGVTYVVVIGSGTASGASVQLELGGWLQVAPVPEGISAADYSALLTSPVVGVDTAYRVDDVATTTLTYRTAEGGGTVVVAPPTVNTDPDHDCGLGEFATIDGPAPVCEAAALSWSVPVVEPTLVLDLEGISDEERAAIAAALEAEAATTIAYPADTYFGAKALYRDAQLLALASELGDQDSFDLVAARLAPAIATWTEPAGCANRNDRCFLYDPVWAGVVGLTPSFGSDEFNDHHFHYGYLIFAATIAVREGIVDEGAVAPVIDALVADIASHGTDSVPTTRVYDPYAGHSWASGTAPFADGNNQESSSEAVMAWTAVAAWARLRGDDTATERVTWMLANESHAALALFVRPDTSFAPEYGHDVVGIQWGAKRDWATWFSADASAMLGIQLIPLAPSQAALLAPRDGTEALRIVDSAESAVPAGTTPQFTDLITMYSALAGQDAKATAWSTAVSLPDAAIDDGLSRAYMLAFIASAH